MRPFLVTVLALLAFPALAQGEGAWRDPRPPLPKREIAFETGTGRHVLLVEVASTEKARDVGLAGRRDVPDGTGMLYDFGSDRDVGMWMRGNLVPLDMVFVREDGQVAEVRDNAQPGDETPVRPPLPVRYVVEVPAGGAAALGIERTDRMLLDPAAVPAR